MCRFIFTLVFAVVSFGTLPSRADTGDDSSELLTRLLELPDVRGSISYAKLEMDKHVDPTVNPIWVRNQVSDLARAVKHLAGPDASDEDLMVTMRTVVYQSGPWNNHRPFSYDHENPQETNPAHKTISYYLKTRKGNCVTMPILILMIGELLDMEMTLTTAPQHLLVHFDPGGYGGDDLQYIEATSGAYPQRVSWLRQLFGSMTDDAVANGMYLPKLDYQQSIAVMGELLLGHEFGQGDYTEVIEVADAMLSVMPNGDSQITAKLSATDLLIRRDIVAHYPSIEAMPPDVFDEFNRLTSYIFHEEQRLADLGWKPPTPPQNPAQ